MCKIYLASGINDTNRAGHKKLYEAMAKVMSKEYSHRDGLGYAAVDNEGNLFGERWLENSEAFEKRTPITDRERMFMKNFKGFIDKKEKYNSFGTVNLDKVTALTLHTRLATSGKEFKNTHPFVENDTSVIHNGVISNWKDLRVEQSTCDSEAILTQYVDNEVGIDIEKFREVAKNLSGYYACGIFSRDVEHNRVLDVVKSASAQLVAAYIPELDSMVFTSLADQIQEGCKQADLVIDGLFTVNPSSIIRINPITGDVGEFYQFEEKSYNNTTYDGYWNGHKWKSYDDNYNEDESVTNNAKNVKKKICRMQTVNGKQVAKYYDANDPKLLEDLKKNADCYTSEDVKKVREHLNKRNN